MTRFLELLAILAVTVALAWGSSSSRLAVLPPALPGAPYPVEDKSVGVSSLSLQSIGMRPATSGRPVAASIPTGTLTGLASWFDVGPGLYGAAGPVLRHALGANWRGSHVIVCHGSACAVVVLSDWCACGPRHGQPTLVDLSRDAFRRIASLSRGIASVTIETGVPVLPATDTAP